jgi:diguanylate cyclase (GGDEF)-like protein
VAAQALVAVALWLASLALARQQQQRDRQQEQLAASLRRATYQAERDQLTRSYNRRHIIELLSREMARSDRTGTPFCVCLLDLDHFKALNDRHGHQAGDRTLASFARRVRGELRTMDSINQAGVPSALGRVGGEEFLVLLPDTTLRGALQVAERIRQCVNQRPLDGRHEVTVSIGMAEYRGSETVGSLLGRADKALYGAKRAGRNRVHAASREGSSAAIVMPQIPRAS